MSAAITAHALHDLEAIDAERLRRAVRSMTLETLLTHPGAFGLTTATPLQRAICRIAEGLPLGELAEHPAVVKALGDVTSLPVGVRPYEIIVLAAIRCAKSLIAAAIAVRAALTCDVSGLRAGEIARVSMLSFKKDAAKPLYDHLVGTLTSKPALKGLLAAEPTAESVLLRHPSGKLVEVMVVAGARAGGSLVARWSAGCIFDEAPRMNGEEDGVINYDDARRAVIGRLLPGAQLVDIGSPWAPMGPIYDAVQEHWGKPSADLVVIKGTGPTMNPSWWTAERCEDMRRRDPQAYRTDVLGEFAQPETALFSAEDLARASAYRKGHPDIPPEPGHSYTAEIDPASRRNAFTLVICCRRRRPEDGKQRTSVVRARQWVPKDEGGRLDPDKVLGEVAAELKPYGLTCVWSDQWAADALKAIANRHGFSLYDETITASRNVEIFESLRMRFADDEIELPDIAAIRDDLLSVRKRVTMTGMTIDLPRTADGRHADFAAVIARAASRPLMDAPLPKRAPTIEEKIAGLRLAEEARWKEVERRGDANAVRRERDWISELEEMTYGPQ